MQEADKAYENIIHAMLVPNDAAERERFIFAMGYLSGKDTVIQRLSSKSSPFSTQ